MHLSYYKLLKFWVVISLFLLASVNFFLIIKPDYFAAGRTPVAVVLRPNASLGCYEQGQSTLSDISTIKNLLPEKSIYFTELSCRTENKILVRQACAVESAAYTNPDHNVYLLFASKEDIRQPGTLSDRLLKILLKYKNVKILHLNFRSLVKNTLVERLYNNNVIQSAKYPIIVASDIARLLLLQKYGGIYLDLDVLVLKPLVNLPSDFASFHATEINNAIFKCTTVDLCQHLTDLCLNEIKNNMEWNMWELTGPIFLTKALMKICNVSNFEAINDADCKGFKVFPDKMFYPIPWRNWYLYFNGLHSQELLNSIINNSLIIHVWNNKSQNLTASTTPHSIYSTLAQLFCPVVFKETGNDF